MKEVEEGNCCFLNLILIASFLSVLRRQNLEIICYACITIYWDDDGVAVFS